MTSEDIYEAVKAGGDAGWKLVWENVIVPEVKSLRSADLVRRYCITDGDLMGMLYEDMIGNRKIEQFRNDGGNLWGWMRQYVRGYVTRANPNPHGEFSLEGTAEQNEQGEPMEIPTDDLGVVRNEVWDMTYRCFKDLWNDDPRKAYVLFLKTRMHLSSAEVAEMLDLSEDNVDQIFSRSVKQMRENWVKHETHRFFRGLTLVACAAASLLAGCLHSGAGSDTVCDIVIYGSSPAALSTAIQAERMGRHAVIVSPESRIGGLTTGGLGQTDIGNKSAFGGIALEFYKAVAAYYADGANWTHQSPASYFPDGQCAGSKGKESMWTFEPSAALKILEGWEKRDGLDVRRGEWLDRERGVVKANGRIVSIRTLSGNVYRGKVFVDATYEGDLMAAAGVSYTVGREANSVYGETLNGNQPEQATYHQLNVGIDPYVVKGDAKSGLLFGVEPYDPTLKPGDGDGRIQAYCFRMCLTDDPENRIPFKKPEGYDARDYELLFRHLAIAPLDRNGMPWINSKMPNRKTDTNNRTGFATDYIGQNWAWPEATYAEREKIRAAHLKYQRGLMWTLANHPRVPETIRNEVSKWGTCKDEFRDGLGDGWQTQLYVREARRMVGEYVMTEHNCWGTKVAPRPVAMGAYQMDSHHVRRYVGADGFVHNEGDVEVKIDVATGKRFAPYPIDYGAVVPKRGECGNLIVPVCLSASHIAFGSIRMEPVFFALGQVAGTAASLAVAHDVPVQDVPYGELSARLVADGQVIGDKPRH